MSIHTLPLSHQMRTSSGNSSLSVQRRKASRSVTQAGTSICCPSLTTVIMNASFAWFVMNSSSPRQLGAVVIEELAAVLRAKAVEHRHHAAHAGGDFQVGIGAAHVGLHPP